MGAEYESSNIANSELNNQNPVRLYRKNGWIEETRDIDVLGILDEVEGLLNEKEGLKRGMPRGASRRNSQYRLNWFSICPPEGVEGDAEVNRYNVYSESDQSEGGLSYRFTVYELDEQDSIFAETEIVLEPSQGMDVEDSKKEVRSQYQEILDNTGYDKLMSE